MAVAERFVPLVEAIGSLSTNPFNRDTHIPQANILASELAPTLPLSAEITYQSDQVAWRPETLPASISPVYREIVGTHYTVERRTAFPFGRFRGREELIVQTLDNPDKSPEVRLRYDTETGTVKSIVVFSAKDGRTVTRPLRRKTKLWSSRG